MGVGGGVVNSARDAPLHRGVSFGAGGEGPAAGGAASTASTDSCKSCVS